MVQRTDYWRNQRLGKFTSSEIYKLMTDPKAAEAKKNGDLSEGAKTYILERIAEEITGMADEFTNDATVWGIETEEKARYFYQKATGNVVTEVGFIEDLNFFDYGGSPDGVCVEQGHAVFDRLHVVNSNAGCIEIKCPFSTAKHLEHCLIKSTEDMPKAYYWQCMSNIHLTNSQWCDFISFDPRINYDMGLFIYRVYRDNHEISRMLSRIEKARAFRDETKRSLGILKD